VSSGSGTGNSPSCDSYSMNGKALREQFAEIII
jgi:hypothetical protein